MLGTELAHFSHICPVNCLHGSSRILAFEITVSSMVCLNKAEESQVSKPYAGFL